MLSFIKYVALDVDMCNNVEGKTYEDVPVVWKIARGLLVKIRDLFVKREF